jgi:glycosyltransferase 2 family protein
VRIAERGASRLALAAASIVVSVVCGYFALRNVNWAATRAAFSAIEYAWLVPSIAGLAFWTVVRVERWRILFRTGRRPPFGALTKATLVGIFFNNVLPARAGEATRVVALRSYAGTPISEAAATIVVERLLDVLSLLLLLFVVAPWLPAISWLRAAVIIAAVAVAVAVILVALAIHLGRGDSRAIVRFGSRIPGLSEGAIVSFAANVGHGLVSLRNGHQAAVALAWSIASWVLLGASFWFIMLGFHLDLSFLAGLLAAVSVGLSFIVPAAPGGVGVFEAAGLLATSAYRIPKANAVACVLALHVVNTVPFLLAGAAVLIFGTRARGERGRLSIDSGTGRE